MPNFEYSVRLGGREITKGETSTDRLTIGRSSSAHVPVTRDLLPLALDSRKLPPPLEVNRLVNKIGAVSREHGEVAPHPTKPSTWVYTHTGRFASTVLVPGEQGRSEEKLVAVGQQVEFHPDKGIHVILHGPEREADRIDHWVVEIKAKK